MPLCHAEVEQAMDDELAELSEIEKRNLGQVSVALAPFVYRVHF